MGMKRETRGVVQRETKAGGQPAVNVRRRVC